MCTRLIISSCRTGTDMLTGSSNTLLVYSTHGGSFKTIIVYPQPRYTHRYRYNKSYLEHLFMPLPQDAENIQVER